MDATWTDQMVEYALRCSKTTEIALNVLGADMGRVALSPDKPFKGSVRLTYCVISVTKCCGLSFLIGGTVRNLFLMEKELPAIFQ